MREGRRWKPRFLSEECIFGIAGNPTISAVALGFEPFVCLFVVSMFSGWHKFKEANNGTRLWLFFHRYAVGYGSHATPFSCPSCLFWSVLRKRATYGTRLCQFTTATPSYGSHAPRLFGTLILWFLQQMMAIAVPPKKVRSRYKSIDFYAVQVFGVVPNAQRASYPGCQRTQRPK